MKRKFELTLSDEVESLNYDNLGPEAELQPQIKISVENILKLANTKGIDEVKKIINKENIDNIKIQTQNSLISTLIYRVKAHLKLPLLDYLFEKGFKSYGTNQHGTEIFHLAISHSLAVAEKFYDNIPEDMRDKVITSVEPKTKRTILHHLLKGLMGVSGCKQLLNIFEKYPLDPNAQDKLGNTALHYLAKNPHRRENLDKVFEVYFEFYDNLNLELRNKEGKKVDDLIGIIFKRKIADIIDDYKLRPSYKFAVKVEENTSQNPVKVEENTTQNPVKVEENTSQNPVKVEENTTQNPDNLLRELFNYEYDINQQDMGLTYFGYNGENIEAVEESLDTEQFINRDYEVKHNISLNDDNLGAEAVLQPQIEISAKNIIKLAETKGIDEVKKIINKENIDNIKIQTQNSLISTLLMSKLKVNLKLPLLDYLFENGFKSYGTNKQGRELLHLAVSHAIAVAEKFYNNIPEDKKDEVITAVEPNTKKTILHHLLKGRIGPSGCEQLLNIFKKYPLDPNAQDKLGNTALHYLAKNPYRRDNLEKVFKIYFECYRNLNLELINKEGKNVNDLFGIFFKRKIADIIDDYKLRAPYNFVVKVEENTTQDPVKVEENTSQNPVKVEENTTQNPDNLLRELFNYEYDINKQDMGLTYFVYNGENIEAVEESLDTEQFINRDYEVKHNISLNDDNLGPEAELQPQIEISAKNIIKLAETEGIDEVKKIINKENIDNIKIQTQNSLISTIISRPTANIKLPLLDYLFENGFKSYGTNQYGNELFHLALSRSFAVAEKLYDNIPEDERYKVITAVERKTNKTILHHLLKGPIGALGCEQLLNIFKKYPLDPNAQDKLGNTALHYLAKNSHHKQTLAKVFKVYFELYDNLNLELRNKEGKKINDLICMNFKGEITNIIDDYKLHAPYNFAVKVEENTSQNHVKVEENTTQDPVNLLSESFNYKYDINQQDMGLIYFGYNGENLEAVGESFNTEQFLNSDYEVKHNISAQNPEDISMDVCASGMLSYEAINNIDEHQSAQQDDACMSLIADDKDSGF